MTFNDSFYDKKYSGLTKTLGKQSHTRRQPKQSHQQKTRATMKVIIIVIILTATSGPKLALGSALDTGRTSPDISTITLTRTGQDETLR